MGKTIEMIGLRFGRLTVIEKDVKRKDRKSRHTFWKCLCDCGNIVTVDGYRLRSGETKSCGCLRDEIRCETIVNYNNQNPTRPDKWKHGKSGTPLYHVYRHMIDRCYDQNNPKFNIYGGRGITVCDEWRNDSSTFFKWADDNGYVSGLTLDRINVNGNYEPDNCRWATLKQQANNRRNTIYVNIDGLNYTLRDISDMTGIKMGTLWYRVKNGIIGNDIIKPIKGDKTA